VAGLVPPFNFLDRQHHLPTLQLAKPQCASLAVAGQNFSAALIWGLRGRYEMCVQILWYIMKKIILYYLG